MSEALEEKRKIELPRALREIVKLLAEEGPMTYEELAEKLEKDETTVIRQAQKLVEMEIAVKVEKNGKAAVALADGVEVDDEGNVYVPSPFEDPVEQLKTLLEEAGVKGRKLRWIMRLVESNPYALQDPNVLYDTLTGAGVRRQLAQQIVKAFFGPNWQPPPGPAPVPGMLGGPRGYPPMPNPYSYGFYPWQPMPNPFEKELLKLEMRFEKLLEELRREKEEKPAFPVIRRVKTDEQGRPVEIIEEPAWMAQRSDSGELTKLLMAIMEQSARQREEMLRLIYEMQRQTQEVVAKLAESQRGVLEELQKAMMEQEKRRLEEMAKLREELIKKDAEWERKLFEERLREMQETIQGIKSYYEQQMQKVLEELKKEWEWRERLRELEERRTLRDVVVEEIRSAGKELMNAAKEMRQVLRDYMEQQLKQNIAQRQVPTVAKEEKRKILEALRRATGRAPSPEPESKPVSSEKKEPEVKLRVVKEG